MADIGKLNRLTVVRMAPPGLYLDGGDLGEILMPRRYIKTNMGPGDALQVFVYRDSEDRLVATTETPRAMVGDFACLKVLSVKPPIGAFLDWGLSKDLLLPFREQEVPVRAGQRVVVCLCLDKQSGRIVATSRLKRHLNLTPPAYWTDQPVGLTIVRRTPQGYEAIVDGAHLGFLFQNADAAPLQIGQEVRGFIRDVRANGKIDLSLDASGYKRVVSLTDEILKALEQGGGQIPFDDNSPPAAIRARFDVSKKAFKQALGALFKARRIRFQNGGVQLIDKPQRSSRA
ncbi:MAG: GntR family transcriptional regulator [Verrucomicrobia bacterium]|nr:GntR family transcriptional regulator [Verrucomicrobiota bacterium]MBI3868245.1 GntR family transcriptional regulator [Verrucomicrobiota bacterium]